MPRTSPTPVAEDLYASAKLVGKVMSRSAAQQWPSGRGSVESWNPATLSPLERSGKFGGAAGPTRTFVPASRPGARGVG